MYVCKRYIKYTSKDFRLLHLTIFNYKIMYFKQFLLHVVWTDFGYTIIYSSDRILCYVRIYTIYIYLPRYIYIYIYIYNLPWYMYIYRTNKILIPINWNGQQKDGIRETNKSDALAIFFVTSLLVFLLIPTLSACWILPFLCFVFTTLSEHESISTVTLHSFLFFPLPPFFPFPLFPVVRVFCFFDLAVTTSISAHSCSSSRSASMGASSVVNFFSLAPTLLRCLPLEGSLSSWDQRSANRRQLSRDFM